VKPQTRGVILLTYYRSGSSFLGELFNQHPNAFYHFEPLFPYTQDCSENPAYLPEKVEFLNKILRCDMSFGWPIHSSLFKHFNGSGRSGPTFNDPDVHIPQRTKDNRKT